MQSCWLQLSRAMESVWSALTVDRALIVLAFAFMTYIMYSVRADVRADVRAEVGGLRADFRADFGGMRLQMQRVERSRV